jgi:hypothetical protein
MSAHHLWGGSSVNRSRLRRSAAVTATVGVGLFVAMAGQPALAAPAPAGSSAFTANAAATLARVDVAVPATPLFPGGSGFLTLVNANNAVDSQAAKASQADATFLNFNLLGITPPALPANSVSQFAPPDNPAPATSALLTIPANPLIHGQILPASAQARWNDAIACPTGPAEIANSEATVAKLKVLTTEGAAALPVDLPAPVALPIPAGVTLVDLSKLLSSSTTSGLVAVKGQHGLGVSSTAAIDVADLTLFKGLPTQTRVQVISQPKLTATAAGTAGKSTVDFEAPILKITDPSGKVFRIDAPTESVTIGLEALQSLPGGLEGVLKQLGSLLPPGALPALPALPALDPAKGYLAKISIGQLTDVVTEPGKASGKLTFLKLELIAPNGNDPLATVTLGEVKAQATAPAGGVTCKPEPSVQPTHTEKPILPVTGSDVTLLIAGGGLLLLLGRFAMVATARRQ